MASAGSSSVGDSVAGVATMDVYYRDLVEDELLTIGLVTEAQAAPEARVVAWSEMKDWQVTVSSMNALGLDAAGTDSFACIGLSTDMHHLSADVLERRRRLLDIVRGAMSTHGWSEADRLAGHNFVVAIDKAVDSCHAQLPELIKRNVRKKKSSGQSSGIAAWQEPSCLIFEYALQQHGNTTCALHLSNLQRFPLTSLCDKLNPGNGMPKVLKINSCRELYTKLSQAQVKIEEALSPFRDGKVILWAPENHEQLPRIIGGLNKLYTEKGCKVEVMFLVPFVPLPGCDTAERILDLWSHPLLQHKYTNVVKEVCFIREPSRCVFTRDNNPVHTTKSLVAITVAANTGGVQPYTFSMRSMLLAEPAGGDMILVDVQTKHATAALAELTKASLTIPGAPVQWSLQGRSRGHSAAQPRSTFSGLIDRASVLEIRAVISGIKSFFGDQDMIIGRSSMFVDRNTIIAEGNLEQITALGPVISECVLISPHKALVTPSASADEFSRILTQDGKMRSMSVRYRKSSVLQGGFYARPKDLPSILLAERHNAYAARQGGVTASLLALQVHIEVLGLDAGTYEDIAGKVMDKIGAETGTSLQESQDPEDALQAGQWRKVAREGSWTGRILLQCADQDDMSSLFRIAHGRGVCVGGLLHSINISSLSNAFLAATALEQQLASSATSS